MNEQQRRNEERIPLVDIKVCLNIDDGKILDCELLDVSPSGARVQLPPGEKRRKGGEKVTLQVSSLPLGGLLNNKQALIIWTDGQQIGMRLSDPLALPEEDMRGILTLNIPAEK